MPVARPEEVVPREPSLSWTGDKYVMDFALVLERGITFVQKPLLTGNDLTHSMK